jgi:sarcosine oxidase subunit gamma
MTTGLRRSPLHDRLIPESPRWAELHGMQTPVELPGDADAAPIMLADASCLPRMGVKGPNAEEWLRGQGVSVPEGANTWTRTSEGVIVARLARSEFFLEDRPGGGAVERWRSLLEPAPGVYPVIRQDAALALAGERLNDLLVQTCNVDFDAYPPGARAVVMTSMVGVSVLALRDEARGRRWLRIWCDGTFGPYLWETLLGIAREEGGAAVGFAKLFPDAAVG